MALRLVSLLRSKSARRRSPANQQQLMAVWHLLQHQPRGNEVLAKVEDLNTRRHRASSAIEGFNAALRPHLYVHKSVTQGFLELFRAHFNLRQRRWGRHKGTSAMPTVPSRWRAYHICTYFNPHTHLLRRCFAQFAAVAIGNAAG